MPPRARTQKPKAEPTPVEVPTAEPTPVEPVVDEQPPVDEPETVEEFRVRATFPNGDTFLVRSGRVYATRADAEGAIFTDQRRYHWAIASEALTYAVEVCTVIRPRGLTRSRREALLPLFAGRCRVACHLASEC